MVLKRRDSMLMAVGVVFLLPFSVEAKVTGLCANCHTMHNSQEGVPMTLDGGGPNSGLLKTNCGGCHQGNNNGANTVPYVWDTSAPSYGQTGNEAGTDTLAGGTFWWVSQGLPGADAKGHNVESVAAQDARLLNTPPGGTDLGGRLTCAGTKGCHGDRAIENEYLSMFGAHHGDEAAGWKDGSTLPNSYRFLMGVQGLEDSTYEYQAGVGGNHNKYYGVDRTSEADVSGTMSGLCGDCHNNFHNGTGQIAEGTFGTSRVWLRHPTDFDMGRVNSGTEFAEYNGGTGTSNPYSVVSPVATASTTATLNTTVYTETDDAIVMCLSCHRPHGTNSNASLRWNYQGWPVGGYNGCVICHTVK